MKYLIIALLFLVSCKKETIANKPIATYSLVGNWQRNSETIYPAYYINGITTTDVYAAEGGCYVQYFITLNSDLTGQVKADCNSPYKPINWYKTNIVDTLEWAYQGQEYLPEIIISLNDSEFKTTTSFTAQSVVYTITNTYTRL